MGRKPLWALGLLLAASSPMYADGPATQPDPHSGYVTAINKAWSVSVTPGNNAAVLLMPLFGAKEYPPEAFPILKSLGFEKLDAPPLEYFDSYLRRNLDRDPDESDADFENRILAMDKTTDAPWKAQDSPVAAAWLEENRDDLQTAVAASRRDRCFIPLFEYHGNDGNFPILIADGGGIKELFVQHALLKQAMLDYGQGDQKNGQEYLLAVHHLARLFAQGPMLTNALVAATIDCRAAVAERELLAHNVLDAQHQRSFLAALSALPPLRPDQRAVTMGVLQWNLAVVHMLQSGELDLGLRQITGVSDETSLDHGDLANCNWTRMETTCRACSLVWDAALKAPDYGKQQAAIAAILEDAAALNGPKFGPEYSPDAIAKQKAAIEAFLKRRAGETNADFTDRIGTWIFLAGAGGYTRALVQIDEAQVQSCLTRTVLALSLYRASHGNYPDGLDPLTPQYLTSIPQDWFSGKPLVYRRNGDAYVLYSAGRNGVDDGGKDQNRDDGDIVVRSP